MTGCALIFFLTMKFPFVSRKLYDSRVEALRAKSAAYDRAFSMASQLAAENLLLRELPQEIRKLKAEVEHQRGVSAMYEEFWISAEDELSTERYCLKLCNEIADQEIAELKSKCSQTNLKRKKKS